MGHSYQETSQDKIKFHKQAGRCQTLKPCMHLSITEQKYMVRYYEHKFVPPAIADSKKQITIKLDYIVTSFMKIIFLFHILTAAIESTGIKTKAIRVEEIY